MYMGFLGKKDQRNIRRVGNKAMKKTSLGLKKGGKLLDRHAEVIAPIASNVASVAAEQPVVITADQVRGVGGQVRNTGKGVEKLRKGDLGGAMEKLAEARMV
tara:strand:- start:750 stop:1055 length:306 start_codon:yes stop_codon:yes gene_type:complete